MCVCVCVCVCVCMCVCVSLKCQSDACKTGGCWLRQFSGWKCVISGKKAFLTTSLLTSYNLSVSELETFGMGLNNRYT